MNKCIICGKGCQGRTCSGACRAKLSRRSIDRQVERTRTVEAHESDKRTVRPDNTGARPMNWGLDDCECRHCQQVKTNRSSNTLNHSSYKSASQLSQGELNRVSLPGDADYEVLR